MSGFDGKDSQLASVVTLGSSLDYTPSRSSLKLLLPLASDKRNWFWWPILFTLFHVSCITLLKIKKKYMWTIFFLQAEPAQALNIPVIPLGPLMATTYPLTNSAPFALSWLISQISAQDMMDQKLLEKLVMNNFCKSQIFTFALLVY